MSLLSNLLTFSSLNNQRQRDQRSVSVGSKFLFQQESPHNRDRINNNEKRQQSKSLSKMNFYSNINIDPKHKCLHKLAHKLGIKIRKHYYGLFVTLQTMKKNNINLYQKQKKTEDPDKFISGLNKLSQIINIIVSKRFQQKWKFQYFEYMKKYSNYSKMVPALKKLQNSVTQIEKRCYLHKFIESLKQQQATVLKLDIFTDTIQNILKTQNRQQYKQQILQSFKLLKSFIDISKNQSIDQTSVSECIYDSKTQFLQNQQKQIKKQLRLNFQSIQFSQKKCITMKSEQTSPTRAASKSITLKKAVNKQNIDNICENISKNYKVITNIQQQPYQTQILLQNVPKNIQKHLPQILGIEQIGDLEDISRIFRQSKTCNRKGKINRNQKVSVISGIDYEEFSDAVSESFIRIQGMINDMEKYRDKNQKILSQSNSKINTIQSIREQYKNESFLSIDAVSFKNSLVNERDSVKNMDRERVSFLKKKNLPPNSKGPVREKNILKQQIDRTIKNESRNSIKKSQRKNLYQQDYLTLQGAQDISKVRQNNNNDFSYLKDNNHNVDSYNYDRVQYNSADKSKSFTFKPKIQNDFQQYETKQLTKQFDQMSDQGINYLFCCPKKYTTTKGNHYNNNSFSINYEGYATNKQVPVKDISLNDKTNNNYYKKPTIKQKQLSHCIYITKNTQTSNYTQSGRRQSLGAPKKFINLIRK